jgi:hypothetical protein
MRVTDIISSGGIVANIGTVLYDKALQLKESFESTGKACEKIELTIHEYKYLYDYLVVGNDDKVFEFNDCQMTSILGMQVVVLEPPFKIEFWGSGQCNLKRQLEYKGYHVIKNCDVEFVGVESMDELKIVCDEILNITTSGMTSDEYKTIKERTPHLLTDKSAYNMARRFLNDADEERNRVVFMCYEGDNPLNLRELIDETYERDFE